jgi:hypothetical protein
LSHLHVCLQCTLVGFTPSIILHSLLKTTSKVSFFYFHASIQSTFTIFTLLYPLCSPSPLFWTGPVLHLCHSFFKSVFIVQGDCSMIFHQWIFCTLIRITPSITFSPIPLCPYYSTAFSVFHYIIYIHRCSIFWYHSLSFILFPFSPPLNSFTITNIFSLSLSLSL